MSRKSIAQIFSPNGTYVPSKCAVHLRSVGITNPAFQINDPVVVDAPNFKEREQNKLSIVLSEPNGFTGSAAIKSIGASSVQDADAPYVSYPIRATEDGKHYVYLRAYGSGSLSAYLDGKIIKNSTWSFGAAWGWVTVEIVLPDTKVHDLQLRLTTPGVQIDKLCISRTPQTYTGVGPDYTESPFVTVHGRLATAVNGVPTTYHNQAWAINTITDVRKDGWYNFDVSTLYGPTVTANSLAFVLTVAGASDLHYIIWDTADKVTNPTAFFGDDEIWVADITTSMAIRVYADFNALDEYNCVINTPEAILETNTVNDFSLEALRPQCNNTVLVDDNIGGNDVTLDIGEKLLTLVVDQSGSMTWNDSTGLRHQFAAGVINALEARYPSPIRLNLLKLNAEPAFSFFIPVSKKIDSNDPSDIIRESFKGKPENFAGFRVVRNTDHYPTTPIDGEIIQDGYALAALDIDLEQNKQYYYTVYTYDHFDRFSYGVNVPVKTNAIDVPRGIPTFSLDLQIGLDVNRDENIIGMWNTDEGDGGYAYDFSDSNNALTLTKTRWLAEYDCPTGRYGLRFNGVTSKAESEFTDKYFFNSADQFSVDGWIVPFANKPLQTIVNYGNDTFRNWGLVLDGLTLKLCRQNGVFASCTTSIPLEEWSHFTVTYNNGTVKFYVTTPNGTFTNTATLAAASDDTGDMNITIGSDPSMGFSPFFGKLSHIHVHDVARDAAYAAGAATPKTRYSKLGEPPGKIPPDNGERLVMAKFEVPEDFNYNLIRIVRNHVRMPYHETDGDVVLEVTPSAGRHSYGLPYDYDIDSDYWFRIFTRNSIGNWCPIEDSVGQQIHIPDQDRPHVVISCGPGCVTEINPGPGYGSCSAPQIEVGRGGNQKVHIRWTEPTNADCTLVKIYYNSEKFVTFDGKTKWIVNSTDGEGDSAVPIFVAPATVGEWVGRDLQNLRTGFYTVVFADRLGRHSSLVNLQIMPSAEYDDSGIPLLEALDVAYHIDDYDRIRITWKSPVTITSSNEGWFDDKFYFYGAICNLYGKPLPIEYPDDLKIVTSIGGVQQSNVEDVFNTITGADTVDRIPNATFSVNSGGMITGLIRLRSSPIFSVLQALNVNVSAEYTYSGTFKWTFPSSSVKFKTPLEMKLYNRDSLYLQTGDFTEPACENDYESGGSDKPKSGQRFRVNGTFIRRKQPFTARAVFTYKGLPLRTATVSARLYDAVGGPCGISVPTLNTTSRTLSFVTNSFEVKLQELPVLDENGNPTGTTAMQSYADIPMKVPQLPQSGRLYVRVRSSAFQSVKRMNMFYPSTLRLSLSATAPQGNGADVREQFARAWFIDPDYPSDQSKIQVVPDQSIIKWTLTKGGSPVRKVPFYSTDTVPLINGVYSYTRSGTARFVFFGPAKSGSEGTYKLKISTTVAGLTAEREADLEIKIPGGNGFENYIPDPTAPRIFCEMDECINYMWADGEDWVKMRIFRNPGDPNKTLVPDEVNGGTKQAKYAAKFRECSVDDDGNPVLFPLPVGTVVTVNAPGYEIVWGSVIEIKDPITGLKKLNAEGAFNALDTADITLGRDNYYTVYFRKDAEIQAAGCRDVNATNCCGFDMANRICNLPHVIGKDTGVIVSTKINLAGKPIIITGGGPIGGDNVARPPCVIVPREPLFFKMVGTFVDNKLVQQMVVDGKTINQVVFELKYRGLPVPAGVCVDVYLVVNVNGQQVTEIGGYDIYTALGIPKTMYTYSATTYPGTNATGNYSFASFSMNPIPIDKNIAIGIGVSTTYNGKDYCTPKGSSSSSSGGA